jgi:hypothetical protein
VAHVYVDSNAVGAGTGADWANAYTTLAAAATAKAAGDNFWVAHNHAETQGSAMTIQFPGTAAAPNTCMCVNSAGTVPPVSADLRTTGTVTTTGASTMAINGYVYMYGLTFNCGSGAVNSALSLLGANAGNQRYVACALKKLGTTGAAAIVVGGTATGNVCNVNLNNTPLTFGATGDSLSVRIAHFTWQNTASAVAGTVPTTLITFANSGAGLTVLDGLDLSNVSGIIVGASTATTKKQLLKNCKVHASATLASTPTVPATSTDVVNCDSGSTNYRNERYTYQAKLSTETTIVLTGGASDGTTPVSWKIVTTANNKWQEPFEAPPIAVWNETTGSSVTLTVQGIWGGAAVPNNDDIWIDVEYLGTSGSTLSSFATSTKADYLATGSALSAGSGTWGGSTTKFKMAVSITPQVKGPIYVVVRSGAASSTFYVDPKVVIT